MAANRARSAGHKLEREIVIKLKELGYSHAITARVGSKEVDDFGIDIMNADERTNGRLPWDIQCKLYSTPVNYHRLLTERKNGPDLVIHGKTEKKGKSGRFYQVGRYAIMSWDKYVQLLEKFEGQFKSFKIGVTSDRGINYHKMLSAPSDIPKLIVHTRKSSKHAYVIMQIERFYKLIKKNDSAD